MVTISTTKIEKCEVQIKQEQQNVGYDIKEFTIEYYVNKYEKGIESENNEIYVPDYQREFIWDDTRQSRFIESIILGLPVPLIFVAEIEEDGRLEIVDGSQRIRTLAAFINDELKLKHLKKLTELNGLSFNDLKESRKRLFKNSSMRMIVLSSRATSEVRNDMFGRINTSSVPLLPMESRRGTYPGKFMSFITKMSEQTLFKKLCPIDLHFDGRREEEELVLRFFAFSEAYPSFKIYGSNIEDGGVARFLDKYLIYKNEHFTKQEFEKKKVDFFEMLQFVDKTFKGRGFGKYQNSTATSRPYFEAISVGSSLAIKKGVPLNTSNLSWSIINKKSPNEFFILLSGRYRTHETSKIKERIDHVVKNLTTVGK